MSHAIVVGASTGIGAALARRLAGAGHTVSLLARSADKLAAVQGEIDTRAGRALAQAYPHDAAATAEAEPLFARIEQERGPVDALYFAAGILERVGPDEFDTEKDVRHFAVNTLGGVAWINAAARRFQARGGGTIVGISSVAGDRGRIGRPAYCATKAGLDCFLESVRNRLWRRGVQVTTIRPGFVATDMIKDAPKVFWVISPDRAAELILRAVGAKRAIAYVPARWRVLMGVIKSVPSFVFRKLSV